MKGKRHCQPYAQIAHCCSESARLHTTSPKRFPRGKGGADKNRCASGVQHLLRYAVARQKAEGLAHLRLKFNAGESAA